MVVEGRSILATLFETDQAPFLVKTGLGGVPERWVPWRAKSGRNFRIFQNRHSGMLPLFGTNGLRSFEQAGRLARILIAQLRERMRVTQTSGQTN